MIIQLGSQPIKTGWKLRILAGLIQGLLFAIILGTIGYFSNIDKSFLVYVLSGLLFGLFTSFLTPLFTHKINIWTGSTINDDMTPVLEENENIEAQGTANLYRIVEDTPGKLFLTNQRVIFIPLANHNHKKSISITYSDIENVVDRKIAFAISCLRFKTSDNKQIMFTVNKLSKWKALVEGKIDCYTSS